jgi:hypothetical protein
MRKRALLTFGTVAAILAFASVYELVALPSHSLNRFLRNVGSVEVGKTRLEDWRQQVEQAQTANVSFRCAQSACTIGWHGENRRGC